MKHARFLRAGSLACLFALCIGLLVACGGMSCSRNNSKEISLDELYAADERPSKPIALQTVNEGIRVEGSLSEMHGNLALFVTRNEDSTLLKEAVYNLTNGTKLYEADEYHDSICVELLDDDLYSVRTQQDDNDSVTTLYDATGKQQFHAESISILDKDLLYANFSVYRIEKGKVKDSGIPVASISAVLRVSDYPGRPSDGYMMDITAERNLTVYDLGLNPTVQYQFPSNAVEGSTICRMLNNGDVLIQYQLEVGSTDNVHISEDAYDFEQDGKLIRLYTLILSVQTGETRKIAFDGILVGCLSRRSYRYGGISLSDKVDNVVTYTPIDSDGHIGCQTVWAAMDNDGTIHPVEKLTSMWPLGLPDPLGNNFWFVRTQAFTSESTYQLYNKSGKLLKSFVSESNFQPKVGWNCFSDGYNIYDESGGIVLDGGKLRVKTCAALYAILMDPDTKERYVYTYDNKKTVALPLGEEEYILSTYDSLFLTGMPGDAWDYSKTDSSLPVRLFNYRGELLGSYPDCLSASVRTSEKNSWLVIECKTDGVVATTIYRLSK